MLQAVKDHLKITWDDEDVHIENIIEQSKRYLDNLIGSDLDYATKDDPQLLLLERCRYVYNNASEYFETNFATDILRLQLRIGVRELNKDATP